MLYNTGNRSLTPAGYYYNAGTTAAPNWVQLITGSFPDVWLTTGNSGTIDGTHFIDTTDNVLLNFRLNNTKAEHIGNNANNSVFLGLKAGFNDDETYNQNIFIGTRFGYSNTTGTGNVANRTFALYSNTTGYLNVAIRYEVLFNNTTGANNVALGYRAGYGANGIYFCQCTFVGSKS